MSDKIALNPKVSGLVFFLTNCIEAFLNASRTIAGVLPGLTTLLFTDGITRTHFAKICVVDPRKRSMGHQHCHRARAKCAVALLVAALSGAGVIAPPGHVYASPSQTPQKIDVIMIGDRLVDVAHGLGVVPAAMSVRCSLWPMCASLKSAVHVLSCPSCLQKKEAAPLVKFARQEKITRVLIEKSDPFCSYIPALKLEEIGRMLADKGFTIEFIDFTNGLETAVRQTADLLGCAQQAADLLAEYNKAMQHTRKMISSRQFAGTVVILNGTYQSGTGKTFLRVEAPGGYADRRLLQPMGIVNVGDKVYPPGKKPSKGHVSLRGLDGLIAAAPDAIVITGDAIAVQKALPEAMVKNPALAGVPAIKAHAIYSLPGYIDSSVIEYPHILGRWASVLAR